MSKSFLQLKDSRAYVIADELSNYIWEIVSKWDWFNKRTLGVQYVSAVDSIGGNISEGFGRYHKKDKQKFYYNARGSVYESISWTQKAKMRKLLSEEEYSRIASD